MHRYVIPQLAIVLVFAFASSLHAEDKPAAKAANVKPCEGTLRIEKRSYKLVHAVAYEMKAFDKDAITVLASDQPIDVAKLTAALRKGEDSLFLFQPHASVVFDSEGKPSYSNSWANNHSLSVSGTKLKGELKVENGRVKGVATLEDDKPEDPKIFDVIFDLPLIAKQVAKLEPKPVASKTANPKSKSKDSDSDDTPAGPMLSIHDLPIPADATDLDMKKLTRHFRFNTPHDYKKMAGIYSKMLADKGWKTDGSDLIGVSAILRRTQGNAKLTIFVKPNGKGSQVTVNNDGLSWDDNEK